MDYTIESIVQAEEIRFVCLKDEVVKIRKKTGCYLNDSLFTFNSV